MANFFLHVQNLQIYLKISFIIEWKKVVIAQKGKLRLTTCTDQVSRLLIRFLDCY
jgi:hypothetical protein